MAAEFNNLGITLSESLRLKIEGKKTGEELLELLSDLNKKAAWAHKEDNMRIEMIQWSVKEWEQELQNKPDPTESEIKMALIDRIKLSMMLAIGDGWWAYVSGGFNHLNESKGPIENAIDYKPITIWQNFGALRRAEMYFVDQPWMDQKTLHYQPFVERSDEAKSIKFAEEYYRYCCNPTDYLWSKIKSEDIWHQERFPITPNVLKHMEEKVWATLPELKIYKFFNMEYKDHIMPTHGLLCQMFLICSLATAPFYLAGWHLWDPEKNQEQFEYYTQFLIHNDAHVIPNRQWFIKVLQILVTLLKNKKEHGSRLVEQEISVDELFPLMKEQDIWPFELYEDLLREKFCLVNNITEGDTIWFKLTGIGIMFLYMCCPKI